MELSEEEVKQFKSIYVETVKLFAEKIGKPVDDVLLQVLPHAVHATSEYLTEKEVKLKAEVKDCENKSKQISQALVLSDKAKEEEDSVKQIPVTDLLGKLVTRGRDWKWLDQDGGAGTVGRVVTIKGSGWVKVVWAGTTTEKKYRWGADDSYDLEIYDGSKEPIPPFDQQIKKPANWLIGRKVKRGRDWKWDDQDGNGIGTVTNVSGTQWVEVKWENNETVSQYRWGDSGCFDVEVVNN